MSQLDGRKSRDSVIVMTNRSNHMPMFTKIEAMKSTVVFVRSFFDQKSCGVMTLQVIIVQ